MTATVLFASAACSSTTARPVAAPGQSSTADTLRQIETDRLAALVEGDVASAARLHARDFELVPPPGYPMKREDYLGALEAGDIDYRAFEPLTPITVRVSGTSAIMWYRSRIEISAAGQGDFSHEAWHMYLYEKQRGSWVVVREQATAVGGFPPTA